MKASNSNNPAMTLAIVMTSYGTTAPVVVATTSVRITCCHCKKLFFLGCFANEYPKNAVGCLTCVARAVKEAGKVLQTL